MLIVDRLATAIRNWAAKSGLENQAWSEVQQLTAGSPADAEKKMKQLLASVESGEAFCLAGRGDDRAAGDQASKNPDRHPG